MKKLLTFCAAICAATTLFAAERVVWEGNKAISWNSEVYPGEQFETPEGTFTGLKKDDTIKVSVLAKIDEPQYVMTYKAGTDWTWTDLPTNVADGLMTYIVASNEIADFIAQRGLIFRGQGYDMTKIIIASEDSEPVDPQDDKIDLTGLTESVVWTGNQRISWNSTEYAGDKLDTYTVKQDMFAGLQVGNVIAVAVTPDGEAQYSLKYKAGDEWSWTELTINTEMADTLAYEVQTEEIARYIADRGLVVDGIRYIATKISIFRAQATAVTNAATTAPARKIIEAGQVFIIKDGVRYNILGTVVR